METRPAQLLHGRHPLIDRLCTESLSASWADIPLPGGRVLTEQPIAMDPPLTPTPGLAGPQSQRASAASTSSPRRCPQQNDYPLSSDSKTENHPMGSRAPGNAPTTTSGTRLKTPTPDGGGGPGKSSKAARRRRNRNRKRSDRRQSFIMLGPEDSHNQSGGLTGTGGAREATEGGRPTPDKSPFFKLGRSPSNTSLDSDALLDHRYATVC